MNEMHLLKICTTLKPDVFKQWWKSAEDCAQQISFRSVDLEKSPELSFKALKFHAYCPVQNAYFLPAPRRFSSNNGSLLCLITVFTDSNVHLFFFFPQENWTDTRSLHLYSLPHNRAVTQRSCLLNTIVFRKNAWMSRSLFTRWLRAQDAGPDMSGNWACLLVQEIPNWVPQTTL